MRPVSVQIEGFRRDGFSSLEQQHIDDLFAQRAELTLERAAVEGDTDILDWFAKGEARKVTIDVAGDGYTGGIGQRLRTITIKRCCPSLAAMNRPAIPGSHTMERIGVWFLLSDVEGWR